ncbi:HupE/UreJ family protein [Mangrovivirga sp. M17]|uniref:HupE/UreJ family protein n=1 Tax=Mangrovivirga halotolerans TaxID=2993936 RepID=A0ABT3RR81_9BACT|nr:HupE/UreJ family protein [Mangrovivirga halotolerans]MCX2743889.1 HupE/UreJ family protein [Mangrovivirga halotolerans]
MIKRYYLIFILMFLPGILLSHEMRPAYLHIKQVNETTYNVFWKIPRRGDMVIRLSPVFPQSESLTEIVMPKLMEGAMLYSYSLTTSNPLEGQDLIIDGLQKTMIDVLVNVDYLNGEKVSFMLKPDDPEKIIPGKMSTFLVIKNYTVLGVEHIWFGIDHLLFVLALIIITKGFKKIVKTITAFTIAHSITLSMAVLGFANLPGPPVEAVIALSIVFLAIEIVKNASGQETITSKKPWLVAFTFGLLHGFGFAGALAEVGLPQTDIPLALAFFNVGVELGQIAFVLVVLLVIRALSYKKNWPLIIKKIPAYAIGSIAAFWTIERIAGFWF